MSVIVPKLNPTLSGVNVAVMVHSADGASVAPQSLVCAKEPPDAAIESMVSVAFPMFFTVTACGALVVPISTNPKFTPYAESETSGSPGDTPIPVRSM